MNIIIKGLDMPQSCEECLLADRYIDISCQKVYYCMVTDTECANGNEKRADSCPLIEIVTCKECEWWDCETSGCDRTHPLAPFRDDDFCSYGERRNDESNT